MKKTGVLRKIVGGIGTIAIFGIVLVASGSDIEAATLYRAYNPSSGEHLYTTNTIEVPHLVKYGWRDEGTAWDTPDNGNPVYRMYNPVAGDHHYTLSAAERDNLKTKGWRYEGLAWNSGGTIPVYRLYNPNAWSGAHHFTTNAGERDNLKTKGWRDEGVAWYATSNNTTPPVNPDTGTTVEKFTVWVTTASPENSSYNLNEGDKIFDTREEAKNWVEDYTDELLMKNISTSNYGVSSYLVKQ